MGWYRTGRPLSQRRALTAPLAGEPVRKVFHIWVLESGKTNVENLRRGFCVGSGGKERGRLWRKKARRDRPFGVFPQLTAPTISVTKRIKISMLERIKFFSVSDRRTQDEIQL
jgi:hypothetical protein